MRSIYFEWDSNKNKLNKQKHGISFETAALVFQDPFLLSVPDTRNNYPEERWQSLGLIQDTLIYVAHTVEEHDNDEETIRIISSRAVTSNEAKHYYANRHDNKRT